MPRRWYSGRMSLRIALLARAATRQPHGPERAFSELLEKLEGWAAPCKLVSPSNPCHGRQHPKRSVGPAVKCPSSKSTEPGIHPVLLDATAARRSVGLAKPGWLSDLDGVDVSLVPTRGTSAHNDSATRRNTSAGRSTTIW